MLYRRPLIFSSHLSILIFLLWATPCTAQTAETQGEEAVQRLEEVKVTARRREERLHDVPVSVAILSGTELESAQVTTVNALGQRFANLAIPDQGSKGQTIVLRIRGFGNNDATRTLRAGIVVDDVPYLSPRGLNPGLFDIRDVQVLRGPQSTLYGLTAEAGLVIVRSAQPDLEKTEGRAALQYSSNSEYVANGRISIPVVPGRFAVSLSAMAAGNDGWIQNVLTRTGYNQSSNWGGRIQALFQATDDLSMHFQVAREEVDDDYGLALVPVDRTSFNATYGTNIGNFESAQNYAGYTANEDKSSALTIRWAAGPGELIAVSTYRDFKTRVSFDIDQGPLPTRLGPFLVGSGEPSDDNDSFSQEVRFQSTGEGPWSWIMGAFYYESDDTSFAKAHIIAPIQTVFTIAPPNTSELNSSSLFGQVGYGWDNGWSATLGARFEDIEFSDKEDGIDRVASGSDHEWLPKFTLSYAPSTESTFYGSVGRGWLAGGVFVGELPSDDQFYEPESSTTYELGVKGIWFDQRLSTNFALFRTNVHDFQETVQTSLLTSETANVGEVRFEGFDLELSALLTENLLLSGGVGYSKARYEDFIQFDPRVGGLVNLKGNRIPGVAEENYILGLTYTHPTGWYATGEMLGSGDILATRDRLNALPVTDGYTVFNLRAGYSWNQWNFLAFINNIADEDYFVSVNNQLGDGVLFGAIGRSRQFGMTVEYAFGR